MQKYEKDKIKIAHYRQLTDSLLESKAKHLYSQEALAETTRLLSLNPEFYTIWNYRRNILNALFAGNELDRKSVLEDDLKFVLLQLRSYPKCYWIWNHRVWCLFTLKDEANWEYELAIVSKLLQADARNFHGWQYRRFVVENLGKRSTKEVSDKTLATAVLLKISINEYKYTTSKINSNISNFSAWHNRSKLIPKIFTALKELGGNGAPADDDKEVYELFKSPYNLLVHELQLIKTGMYMDADDSSVWLYLHWLVGDDFFVSDLKSQGSSKERLSYVALLQQQLDSVSELNELEKDDHPQGLDNHWCLKTIIYLKTLIKREQEGEAMDDEIRDLLHRMIEIDPIRKGRYMDQLNGKSTVLV